MTKVEEGKNKYNEDKVIISYPSPFNLYNPSGMEFFNNSSISRLSFSCITQKEQGAHPLCLALHSS